MPANPYNKKKPELYPTRRGTTMKGVTNNREMDRRIRLLAIRNNVYRDISPLNIEEKLPVGVRLA